MSQEPVLLDGKAVSRRIRGALGDRVSQLFAQEKVIPRLAAILVGDDPASATYVRMKQKACEELGMESRLVRLDADTRTETLLDSIIALNEDPDVHGILLQHPVPPQIDERLCFDAIAASKDVDGVTSAGFGRISFGLEGAYPGCTPAGIMRLLDEYGINYSGKRAVVVGRSAILGRPMAALLLLRDATVTVAHSRSGDLSEILKDADIIVAACGKPELIRGEWLKPGVVVADAGYNPGNVGDAHFASCAEKAAYITPVPGGVGPMTITMLLGHTIQAAERAVGKTAQPF